MAGGWRVTTAPAVRMLAVATIVVGVRACGNANEPPLGEDQPPAYADGYRDGCETGRKAGGDPFSVFIKNTQRYEVEAPYQRGWDDGFNACEAQEFGRPGRPGGPFRM